MIVSIMIVVLMILNQRVFSGLTSFTFLAVPMLILAGELMIRVQLIDKLLDVARIFVGHFRGGLARSTSCPACPLPELRGRHRPISRRRGPPSCPR